jgi:hypothetical protein
MFTPVSERSDALQRNVKIANLIALIFAILALVLLLATVWLFGTSVSTPFTILTSLVYLFVIALNRFGFTNIGRILLCVFMPIITLYITILLKTSGTHSDILYYDSRVILLASGLVPCLIFHTRERFKLYGLLSFALLCLDFIRSDSRSPRSGLLPKGIYRQNRTTTSTTLRWSPSVAISISAMILKIISERAEAA